MIYVKNGATLTIQAGTKIFAEMSETKPVGLVISIMGTINAAGTATAPIIFTMNGDDLSKTTYASKSVGCYANHWTGVIILGKSTVTNFAHNNWDTPPTVPILEAFFANVVENSYGSAMPSASANSGTFTHVSIRGAGKGYCHTTDTNQYSTSFSCGSNPNEVDKSHPALFLGGLQSSFLVHHVEVYASGETGILLSGGDVRTRRLIVGYAYHSSFAVRGGYNGAYNERWVSYGSGGPALKIGEDSLGAVSANSYLRLYGATFAGVGYRSPPYSCQGTSGEQHVQPAFEARYWASMHLYNVVATQFKRKAFAFHTTGSDMDKQAEERVILGLGAMAGGITIRHASFYCSDCEGGNAGDPSNHQSSTVDLTKPLLWDARAVAIVSGLPAGTWGPGQATRTIYRNFDYLGAILSDDNDALDFKPDHEVLPASSGDPTRWYFAKPEYEEGLKAVSVILRPGNYVEIQLDRRIVAEEGASVTQTITNGVGTLQKSSNCYTYSTSDQAAISAGTSEQAQCTSVTGRVWNDMVNYPGCGGCNCCVTYTSTAIEDGANDFVYKCSTGSTFATYNHFTLTEPQKQHAVNTWGHDKAPSYWACVQGCSGTCSIHSPNLISGDPPEQAKGPMAAIGSFIRIQGNSEFRKHTMLTAGLITVTNVQEKSPNAMTPDGNTPPLQVQFGFPSTQLVTASAGQAVSQRVGSSAALGYVDSTVTGSATLNVRVISGDFNAMDGLFISTFYQIADLRNQGALMHGGFDWPDGWTRLSQDAKGQVVATIDCSGAPQPNFNPSDCAFLMGGTGPPVGVGAGPGAATCGSKDQDNPGAGPVTDAECKNGGANLVYDIAKEHDTCDNNPCSGGDFSITKCCKDSTAPPAPGGPTPGGPTGPTCGAKNTDVPGAGPVTDAECQTSDAGFVYDTAKQATACDNDPCSGTDFAISKCCKVGGGPAPGPGPTATCGAKDTDSGGAVTDSECQTAVGIAAAKYDSTQATSACVQGVAQCNQADLIQTCCKADCQGSWGAWGACDPHSGKQSRSYTATSQPVGTGQGCPNPSTQEQQCSNCFGSWSIFWDTCDQSGGAADGQQRQTYSITTPASGAGTSSCPNAQGDQRTQACSACFGSWSAWGTCTGGNPGPNDGKQSRTFTVTRTQKGSGTANCVATSGDVEQQDCIPPVGDTDCVGSWTAWGACSQTHSTQSRTYTVTQSPTGAGTACPVSPQTQVCTPDVNCAGTWSSWSTCAGSSQQRTFTVNTAKSGTGTPCPSSPETQVCNDCEVTWGQWSSCPTGGLTPYKGNAGTLCSALGAGSSYVTDDAACTQAIATLGITISGAHDVVNDANIQCACVVQSSNGFSHFNTKTSMCSSRGDISPICMVTGGQQTRTIASTVNPQRGHGTAACPQNSQSRVCSACTGFWSSWGACDPINEQRTYTITRSVQGGGAACPAADGDFQVRPCSSGSVDCVGSWGQWTSCGAPSTGNQERVYTVTTAKQGTGTSCSATHGQKQTQACSNCAGSWSSWGACSTNTQTRTYTVATAQTGHGTSSCPSSPESRTCSSDVDCIGSWSAWGTCASSSQTRSFFISTAKVGGGQACVATSGQSQSQACANCVYSWGAWGTCTSSTQTRTITISTNQVGHGTNPCPSSPQSQACGDCVGSWGSWGACSGGTQTRQYSISTGKSGAGAQDCPQAGGDAQNQACRDCAVAWGGWGACTSGTQSRTHSVVTTQTGHGTAACPTSPATQACGDCAGTWSAWGACSGSTQSRSFTMTSAKTGVGTADCPSSPASQACGDCVGAWGTWAPCAQGKRTRSYVVTVPKSGSGTAACPSPQEKSCSDCAGAWGAWSACDLATSKQSATYVLSSPATGGGLACPAANGDKKSQACVPVINCIGSWGAWTTCSDLKQSAVYSVTTAASGGGGACEAQDKATKSQACTGGSQSCQGSWGQWKACSSDGQQTSAYVVTLAAANGGTVCEATDGQIKSQNCTAPVNCMGDWGSWTSCDIQKKEQTRQYAITTPAAGAGTKCIANDKQAETRSCVPNVDCQGGWQPWSACDKVTTSHQRVFRITAAASGTGTTCPKVDMETETRPCTPVVDCVGSWGDWSACNRQTFKRLRTFMVSTKASGGGISCSVSDQDVERQTCTPVIDCAGDWADWTECSPATLLQSATFSVTTPASANGRPCVIDDKATKTRSCTPIQHCEGSWGSWGECSQTTLTQSATYSVKTQAAKDGRACEAANGAIREQACEPGKIVLEECLTDEVKSSPVHYGGLTACVNFGKNGAKCVATCKEGFVVAGSSEAVCGPVLSKSSSNVQLVTHYAYALSPDFICVQRKPSLKSITLVGAGSTVEASLTDDAPHIIGRSFPETVTCATLLDVIPSPDGPKDLKAALGTGARCEWASPRLIIIHLGSGSVVRAGSTGFALIDYWNSHFDPNSPARIAKLSPEIKAFPFMFSLSGATSLGPCDDLDLDVEITGTPGVVSSIAYTWQVTTTSKADGSESSLGLSRADIAAWNRLLIKGNQIPIGVAIAVSLQATNSLGQKWTATFKAVAQEIALPRIRIFGSSDRTVETADKVAISADIDQPDEACLATTSPGDAAADTKSLVDHFAATGIEATWTVQVTPASTPLSFAVVGTTTTNARVAREHVFEGGRFLSLPQYALKPEASYIFTLRVKSTTDPTKKPVEAAVRVSVKGQASVPVIAAIEGGTNRAIGASTSLVLDAVTGSRDPLHRTVGLAQLAFEWSCSRLLGTAEATCDNLYIGNRGATGTLSVEPGVLLPKNKYRFTVEVWRSGNGVVRTTSQAGAAKAEQIIEVTPSSKFALPPITAAIQKREGVVLRKGRWIAGAMSQISIAGSPVDPSTPAAGDIDASKLQWLSSKVNMADPAKFAVGAGPRGSWNLVINPNQLVPRESYEFTLRLGSPDGSTYVTSSVSVYVNAPPTAGSIDVSPAAGEVALKDFQASTRNWLSSADALPLKFQFSGSYDFVAASSTTTTSSSGSTTCLGSEYKNVVLLSAFSSKNKRDFTVPTPPLESPVKLPATMRMFVVAQDDFGAKSLPEDGANSCIDVSITSNEKAGDALLGVIDSAVESLGKGGSMGTAGVEKLKNLVQLAQTIEKQPTPPSAGAPDAPDQSAAAEKVKSKAKVLFKQAVAGTEVPQDKDNTEMLMAAAAALYSAGPSSATANGGSSSGTGMAKPPSSQGPQTTPGAQAPQSPQGPQTPESPQSPQAPQTPQGPQSPQGGSQTPQGPKDTPSGSTPPTVPPVAPGGSSSDAPAPPQSTVPAPSPLPPRLSAADMQDVTNVLTSIVGRAVKTGASETFGKTAVTLLSGVLDSAVHTVAEPVSPATSASSPRPANRRLVALQGGVKNATARIPTILQGVATAVLRDFVPGQQSKPVEAPFLSCSMQRVSTSSLGAQASGLGSSMLPVPEPSGLTQAPGSEQKRTGDRVAFGLPRALPPGAKDVVMISYGADPHSDDAAARPGRRLGESQAGRDGAATGVPWDGRVWSLDMQLPDGSKYALEGFDLRNDPIVIQFPVLAATERSGIVSAEKNKALVEWKWANKSAAASPAAFTGYSFDRVMALCNFSLCIDRLRNTSQEFAALDIKAKAEQEKGAYSANLETKNQLLLLAIEGCRTKEAQSLWDGLERRPLGSTCPDKCIWYSEKHDQWEGGGCIAAGIYPDKLYAAGYHLACHCNHATSFARALTRIGNRFSKLPDVFAADIEFTEFLVIILSINGAVVLLFFVSLFQSAHTNQRLINKLASFVATDSIRMLHQHSSAVRSHSYNPEGKGLRPPSLQRMVPVDRVEQGGAATRKPGGLEHIPNVVFVPRKRTEGARRTSTFRRAASIQAAARRSRRPSITEGQTPETMMTHGSAAARRQMNLDPATLSHSPAAATWAALASDNSQKKESALPSTYAKAIQAQVSKHDVLRRVTPGSAAGAVTVASVTVNPGAFVLDLDMDAEVEFDKVVSFEDDDHQTGRGGPRGGLSPFLHMGDNNASGKPPVLAPGRRGRRGGLATGMVHTHDPVADLHRHRQDRIRQREELRKRREDQLKQEQIQRERRQQWCKAHGPAFVRSERLRKFKALVKEDPGLALLQYTILERAREHREFHGEGESISLRELFQRMGTEDGVVTKKSFEAAARALQLSKSINNLFPRPLQLVGQVKKKTSLRKTAMPPANDIVVVRSPQAYSEEALETSSEMESSQMSEEESPAEELSNQALALSSHFEKTGKEADLDEVAEVDDVNFATSDSEQYEDEDEDEDEDDEVQPSVLERFWYAVDVDGSAEIDTDEFAVLLLTICTDADKPTTATARAASGNRTSGSFFVKKGSFISPATAGPGANKHDSFFVKKGSFITPKASSDLATSRGSSMVVSIKKAQVTEIANTAVDQGPERIRVRGVSLWNDFTRNMWEYHYVLRIFYGDDMWLTKSQRATIFFSAIFSKMMILSIMFEFKMYAELSRSDYLAVPNTSGDAAFAWQILAVFVCVAVSSLVHRPIHMMHRYDSKLRRKRAILVLRDVLLEDVPAHGHIQQGIKRLFVSQMLLEHLRDDEKLHRRSLETSLAGRAKDVFCCCDEQDGDVDEDDVAIDHRRPPSRSSPQERARMRDRMKRANMMSSRNLRRRRTPSRGWVICSYLMTWFCTFLFAGISTFFSTYFFLYEQFGAKENSTLETSIGPVVNSGGMSLVTVRDSNIERWFRSFGQSLAIWLLATHPLYIFVRRTLLPYIRLQRLRKKNMSLSKTTKTRMKDYIFADLKLVLLDMENDEEEEDEAGQTASGGASSHAVALASARGKGAAISYDDLSRNRTSSWAGMPPHGGESSEKM